MNITCIDFETANPFWGSICSVGVAVTDGKEITKTLNKFIKPHPAHSVFNRDNIRVHGIKPEMVRDAPEFDALYPEIKPLIEGGIIAAHNTSFDVDCLRDVLTLYNIPIPSFEHICTCELAAKVWTGLKSYRLKSVSSFLGYKFRHHDAGEDALAAANILIKAMEKTGIYDIRLLAESAGVKIREVKAGEGYELSSERQKKKLENRVDARDIKAENTSFDESHPFFNREMVFTGQFSNGLSRRQAMQQAVNAGARLLNYVRRATDYLVHGDADKGRDSSKLRRAKSLIETGAGIKIIGENDFLKIISNGRQ